MCGAYGLSVNTIKDIINRFDIEIDDENIESLRPRWNIRPGQHNPVVIKKAGRPFSFS